MNCGYLFNASFILFSPGIGYDLLVDMIKYMKPTHVVQIRTTSENKNLPDGAFWSDRTLEENVSLINLFAPCTDSFNQT